MFPGRRGRAGKRSARSARALRYRGALRRHVERGGRPFASSRLEARQARHCRARRGAQARKAALPRGRRGEAGHRSARLSDVRDLHVSCVRGADHPRARGPIAGGGAHDRGHGSGACPLGAWAAGIRAGGAGRGRARPGRAADRQGLGLGDEFLAGRRLHRDRCAGDSTRLGHARAGDAPRRIGAGARSADHRKPLHCARRGVGHARRAWIGGAHDRGRQPRRRRGGAARGVRSGAGASLGSRERHLQQAPARAGAFAGARVGAHAGNRVPAGRQALRGAQRRGSAEDRARRSDRAHGQQKFRRRHAPSHRQAAGRGAARRLCQPAALAQRRCRRGRPGPRRLGRGDRAGRAYVRPRVPAAWRRSTTTSCWWKRGANGRRCRRSSRRSRTPRRARKSARSACAL